MVRWSKRVGLLLVFLAAGCGCPEGDNPYYCLASPSDFAMDVADAENPSDVRSESMVDVPVNVDAADVADVSIVPDVIDVAMIEEDVSDVPGLDDVLDAQVPPDVQSADASEVLDAGDAPDASDVPDVSDVTDATDVVDVVSVMDIVFVMDIPVNPVDVVTVDRLDAPDVVVIDTPDVPDVFDAGVDQPPSDTGPDVQAVDMVDAGDVVDAPPPVDIVDVVDAPDVVDVPDVPDVPPPPDLVIEYDSRGFVPPGGLFPSLAYAYEGMGAPWPRCPAERFTRDGSIWWSRCTFQRSPAEYQSARVLYLGVPVACGSVDNPCPSNWAEHWIVVWRGRIYRSSDQIAREGGSVPAIQLRSQSYCRARGYDDICLEFAIP